MLHSVTEWQIWLRVLLSLREKISQNPKNAQLEPTNFLACNAILSPLPTQRLLSCDVIPTASGNCFTWEKLTMQHALLCTERNATCQFCCSLKFFKAISMLHRVFPMDGILNQLNKMKNMQNFCVIFLGLLVKCSRCVSAHTEMSCAVETPHTDTPLELG